MKAQKWKYVPLGKLTKRIGGGTPSRKNLEYFRGATPWITVADIPKDCTGIFEIYTAREFITDQAIEESAAKRIPPGSVVLATRVSVGKVGITTREICTNQDFTSLPPTPELDSEFLAYRLLHESQMLLSQTRGSTIKGITTSVVDAIEVPVISLAEQRRIVERIKECLSRIDEIERLRAETLNEVAAVEISLLHQRFCDIKAQFSEKTLETIAEIRGGNSLPRGVPFESPQEGTLLVKVGDMNLSGNEIYVSMARERLPEKRQSAWPVGAIVFPKRGGAIATNKKRILSHPALLDPNLMGIISRDELVLNKFLYYWFLAFDLTTLISGSTVPQLNRKDLAPLEIPCPPLEIQRVVVDELDALCKNARALHAEISSTLPDVEHLAGSVLSRVFAGEL